MTILRALFILIAVAVCLPSTAAGLRVATSPWAPYVDTTAPANGLAVELVSTALNRAGQAHTVSIGNWSSTLEGARLGVFDAIAAIWYTDERARTFAFSRPYFMNNIKLIKRTGYDFELGSRDDLRGRLIGIVRDYAYDAQFDAARDLIKIPANHVIQNLLKVLNGELHLTLDDEWVLREQIHRYLPRRKAELAIVDKPLTVRGLHFAVSRRHPQHDAIIADFDRSLQQMIGDGSYQAILHRHLKPYQ